MRDMKITKQQWYQIAKSEAKKPIPTSERVWSVIFFVVSITMLIYLASLQIEGSNFYTDKFGMLEMLGQYGFWLVWVITAGLEGVLGRRFESRVFDIFGGILFATVATLWLVIVFPYDFSYFTDLMPDLIKPLFDWINNEIGRLILFLVFIFHLVAIFISPFAYKFIGKEDLEGILTKISKK
jgi:hypothetical protein